MSLAWPGITHCANCGTSLNMNEHYYCTNCEEEVNKLKEEQKFKDAVAKQVQLEMAKLTQKIETLEIVQSNGIIYGIQGYWKDNQFHMIE